MHRNHTNVHTWPGIGSILLLFLGLTLGNSQTPIAPISTLGGSWSTGYGLNGLGMAVGNSYLPGNMTEHAFFSNGSTMLDLGPLGGSFSVGITGPLTANLRAEETREGRTYTLTTKTKDAAGKYSIGTVQVGVGTPKL